MKRFLTLSVVVACAASCRHAADPAPEHIAQTFLAAYFQIDFDRALPLCAPALQSDLERSAQTIGELPGPMQDKLRSDLGAYSFKIGSIRLNSLKDSAFISYTIFTPEASGGIPSHLTLAKEDNTWMVAKLL